jgi:signal transduction histidine kinase
LHRCSIWITFETVKRIFSKLNALKFSFMSTTSESTLAVEQIDAMLLESQPILITHTNKAIELLTAAKKLSREHGYNKGLTDSLSQLATCAFIQSDYPQALDYIQEALLFFDEDDHSVELMSLYNLWGLIYERQGLYYDALTIFQRLLQNPFLIAHEYERGTLLSNIGMVYSDMEDFPAALSFYLQSLSVFERIGKRQAEYTCLHNLASLYQSLSNHEDALLFCEQSLQIKRELNHRHNEASSLIAIGELHLAGNRFFEAITYLEKGLELAEEFSDRVMEIFALRVFGYLYLKATKEPDYTTNPESKTILFSAAKDFLSRAANLAEVLGMKGYLRDIYIALSEAFEGLGDLSAALDYHKRYTELKDWSYKTNLHRKLDHVKIHQRLDLAAVALSSANSDSAKDIAGKVIADAQQFRQDMYALAMHDLKNPLQAITSYAELLEMKSADPEKTLRYAKNILLSSKRMIGIIDDFLILSTLEAKPEMTLSEVNVSKLLQSILSTFSEQMKAKNQTLSLTILDECYLKVDANKLAAIFENLISNAIKYSPLSKTIEVRLEKMLPKIDSVTNSLQLSVRDEGLGLTEEDKEKIFGKFQKLSSKPTGGESSTGLGLAIVKRLVELHQGKVWVHSDGRDKGTTFFLELPMN